MENETTTTSRLALIRTARNFTQADVADYLGLPVEFIEEFETGERKMNMLVANKLAQYFNVTPTYFMGEEAQEKKEEGENKEKTLGEKILFLRKSRGFTQADLGALLNISYQAVSKWERDESCPDFETLSMLAKHFNVSVAYFEKESKEKITASPNQAGNGEMVGVCTACGRAIYENEEYAKEPMLVCNDCVERRERLHKQRAKQQAENAKKEVAKQQEEKKRKATARKAAIKRSRNKGLIWAAVIIGLMYLIYIISAISDGESAGIIIHTSGLGILFFYTYVAQLFWDGAVVDCTLAGGKVIGTPGVIFTLDVDGLIFLIGVKLLFAVLRFLIYILTLLLCVIAAILISPFTFVPALVRVSRGDLVD